MTLAFFLVYIFCTRGGTMKKIIFFLLFSMNIFAQDGLVAFKKYSNLYVYNSAGKEIINEYGITNYKISNRIAAYFKHGTLVAVNSSGQEIINAYGASNVKISDYLLGFIRLGTLYVYNYQGQEILSEYGVSEYELSTDKDLVLKKE